MGKLRHRVSFAKPNSLGWKWVAIKGGLHGWPRFPGKKNVDFLGSYASHRSSGVPSSGFRGRNSVVSSDMALVWSGRVGLESYGSGSFFEFEPVARDCG